MAGTSVPAFTRGRLVAGLGAVSLIVGIGVFLAVIRGPTTDPGMAHARFQGDWFAFTYPEEWRVISRHEQYGMHGPMVMAAVGIGDFDLGCTVTPNSVSCPPSPIWTVPDDGVVLVYHFGPICCPIPPQPTPKLAFGEQWVEVDGRAAVLTRMDFGMVWHLPDAPEYIEARWGRNADMKARSQVEALIASWEWLTEPAP